MGGQALTMPATLGSCWLYSSAVTAPMLRPHSPMLEVLPAGGRAAVKAAAQPARATWAALAFFWRHGIVPSPALRLQPTFLPQVLHCSC